MSKTGLLLVIGVHPNVGLKGFLSDVSSCSLKKNYHLSRLLKRYKSVNCAVEGGGG